MSWLEFNGVLFEGLRRAMGDALVKGTGLLSVITLIGLGVYSFTLWKKKRADWPEAMLWLLAIYLFGAQAVQPWYVLPLLAFAVLTGWRWPVLWTLLIVPTYLTYSTVLSPSPIGGSLWNMGYLPCSCFGRCGNIAGKELPPLDEGTAVSKRRINDAPLATQLSQYLALALIEAFPCSTIEEPGCMSSLALLSKSSTAPGIKCITELLSS
ncbi:MAG: hypothetical protein IPI05_16745 [Flavobacteriales bacterium]|nr:hypothetical protein [Flavobacteriales bacterium]